MRSTIPMFAVAFATMFGTARADTPELRDVSPTVQGAAWTVSCSLDGGLTEERLEEIAAGLETTIGYRLSLFRRRQGLPDEAVLKKRVLCTVRYDALTRQYTLTRSIDDEMDVSRVTPDEAAMRDFLTHLDRVPLLPTSELTSGEEYYLKARADLGLMWRFYLIPWPLDTPWVRVPLVPPGGARNEPQP